MRALLTSLVFLITACAPRGGNSDKLVSVNIIDQNGFSESISDAHRLTKYASVDYLKPQTYQKVLRVYRTDKSGNNKAVITSYHPNGQIRQYLEAENSRARGIYREWHNNGSPKIEGAVVGGIGDLTDEAQQTWLFDGTNRAWNENKQLEAEITYAKGLLHGKATHYHSSGAVWKEMNYQSGEADGTVMVYLPNGTLLQKTDYHHGVPHGKSLRYWSNSQIASDETYDDGLLNHATYWSKTSEQVASIEAGNGQRALFGKDYLQELHTYRNGIAEGEVTVFEAKDQIARRYAVLEGSKHGEEVFYYPSGKRKLSIHWVRGNINGEVNSWYPSGTQESRREMSQNQREGISSAWYGDGSLMLIEEYSSDHLVRGEYHRKGASEIASKVTNGHGEAFLFDENGIFLQKILYQDGQPVR